MVSFAILLIPSVPIDGFFYPRQLEYRNKKNDHGVGTKIYLQVVDAPSMYTVLYIFLKQ
jgi:hypothetical protein